MSDEEVLVSSEHTERENEYTAEQCYTSGLQALEKGEWETAYRWAERCDALRENSADVRCLLLRGLLSMETGDLNAAYAHFQQAVQCSPRDVVAARRLSQLQMLRGEFQEAMLTLENVAQFAPDNADLLVDLGYTYLQSNNRTRAEAAFERASSLRPDDHTIQYLLATVYESLGETEKAVTVLLSLALLVVSPRLLTDLALLYLQLKQWSEAHAVFVKLQAIDPDNSLVLLHARIWCWMQKRDWRKAFELALTATQQDRYGLTTALLAYINSQLFGQPGGQVELKEELEKRIMEELYHYTELHTGEDIFHQEDIHV